jgi:hypothetical protein
MIFGQKYKWLAELSGKKDAHLHEIMIPASAINGMKLDIRDAGAPFHRLAFCFRALAFRSWFFCSHSTQRKFVSCAGRLPHFTQEPDFLRLS